MHATKTMTLRGRLVSQVSKMSTHRSRRRSPRIGLKCLGYCGCMCVSCSPRSTTNVLQGPPECWGTAGGVRAGDTARLPREEGRQLRVRPHPHRCLAARPPLCSGHRHLLEDPCASGSGCVHGSRDCKATCRLAHRRALVAAPVEGLIGPSKTFSLSRQRSGIDLLLLD